MSNQDIEDIYELSPLQQGMLFHAIYSPSLGEYIEQESFPLDGPVDISILARAWQRVVERHPVLRSSFHWEGLERPVQVVHSDLQLPFEIQNWRNLPLDEQQERLESYLKADRERGFDLSKAPLIRVTIIERVHDVQFVLSFHHILLDGWSGSLITEEVWKFYESYCEGKDLQLPPARPYSDFIAWLQRQDLNKAERFWRRVLEGFKSPTRFAIDNGMQRNLKSVGDQGERSARLTKQSTAALQRLGRENGLTINTIIQATWAILLSRYSGNNDIVFGSVVSGRPAQLAGVESMVGLFINTLPMRTRVLPNELCLHWLKEVQNQQLEAREYEFSPLVLVQQWSDIESREALFESIVVFANYPFRGSSEEEEGDGESEFHYFAKTSYPLTLMVVPGKKLSLSLIYSTQRFDDVAISKMLDNFEAILNGLVADPHRRVGDLPIMTERERRKLVFDWNATVSQYPREATIVSLFEAQVAREPSATALIFEDAHVSYGELNRRANRLARHLRSLGVGPGKRVGICAVPSIDMVVGLLAILKAGGAYVPLDPANPVDRIAYMVNDAGLEILLSQGRVEGRLPRSGATRVSLEHWDNPEEDSGNLGLPISADDLAYVIYTSGSTGKPKGVLAMHRGAINRFAWMWEAYPFVAQEVCCARTSLSFVDSVWEIFGPLLAGIRSVIIPEEKVKDVPQLVSTLAEQDVTRLVLVPSLLAAMLDSFGDLGVRLRQLKYWFTSGEALRADLARQFQSHVPHGLLINLYGSSEVAGDVTWFDVSKAGTLLNVPIGRPIANTQVYIVDSELRLTPDGVPGELLIGGDGLARGYHNLPELTEEKFIPNPFGKGRLYKTGDLGRYLANSQIEFLGRRDRQVKLRGHRIELGDIEAALLRHPSVRQASVLFREVAGEQELVAYVVRDLDYDGSELRRGASSWREEQLRGWQEVWGGTYTNSTVATDPTLNFAGWNSSYTGLPIPADEMREWVTQSAEAVLSFKPKRVLEIGCGVGLMLFQIAPHCDHYCGTDFSSEALRYVKTQLLEQTLHNVDLLQRSADDFNGFAPQSFDIVILNSVVQYFPNIEYLIEVLKGSIDVLRNGGTIYMGDIRSFPLLEVFHTSVELNRAPPRLTIGQLRERIRKSLIGEVELLIEPGLFHVLKDQLPRIGEVHVAPKRGRFQNELTRFRYQVTIKLDAPPHVGKPSVLQLDWERDYLSVPAIQELLRKKNRLEITGVPNGRLTREMRALELVAAFDKSALVSDLQETLSSFKDNGVDPEDLWALQNEGLWSVQLSWGGTSDDCFHALFCPKGEEEQVGGLAVTCPALSIESDVPRSLNSYSNSPVKEMQSQALMSELRRFLTTVLPDYMVPAAFIFLDTFPLTGSGKLDYTALPAFDRSRPARRRAHIAPRTPTEKLLAGIWTQVLGVEHVDIYDNFFEAGGHSLLATRLLSRVRETFKLDLSLRVIFETPTVVGLADALDAELSRGGADDTPGVVPLSRRARAATVLPNGMIALADISEAEREIRLSGDPQLPLE